MLDPDPFSAETQINVGSGESATLSRDSQHAMPATQYQTKVLIEVIRCDNNCGFWLTRNDVTVLLIMVGSTQGESKIISAHRVTIHNFVKTKLCDQVLVRRDQNFSRCDPIFANQSWIRILWDSSPISMSNSTRSFYATSKKFSV